VRFRSGPVFFMYARHVAMPMAVPFVATAILPALWEARRRRTRQRLRCQLCPACGYDLRATPDRCPECGAASPS
jgi:hypothetical protein